MDELLKIHEKLFFTDKKKLLKEIPEQLMVLKHIKHNDIVLELGGSIGRNSCIINYLLSNKKNHVIIEPNLNEAKKLIKNRDLNNFKFQVETSAISNKKLYSKKWNTYDKPVKGSTEVSIISYNDLLEKYKLNFNVLIIDNEGNFVDTLKNFPQILMGIRLLQIEHDFKSEKDLKFFKLTMEKYNFSLKDKFLKEQKYAPGINWKHGIKTDPIFVSVWSKSN